MERPKDPPNSACVDEEIIVIIIRGRGVVVIVVGVQST
jgi:hypothetical protein